MNYINRKIISAYNRKIKAAAEYHTELSEYGSVQWRKSMAHWIVNLRQQFPKRDIGVTFTVMGDECDE